jgi:hypothetical protein
MTLRVACRRSLCAAAVAAFLVLAVLTLASLAGCSRHALVDAVASSAHRPERIDPVRLGAVPGRPGARWQLLAGDMHCHVSPPDDPSDVSRGLEDTLRLARAEGLDFVVLTPHVWSRFYQREDLRAAVLSGQRWLRGALAELRADDVLFVPGFEYTDHEFGHVGVAFGDLERTLESLGAEEARRAPERFFERYVDSGGVLVVNHPLVTPLDSVVSMARADLSWRPFTTKGPMPPEIAAVNRLAQGFEAYNLAVTHLRDRYLLGDTERSLRSTLALLDGEVVRRRRRMTPVGGSDSHSQHLRATTFLLAGGRDAAAVRDAVLAGRTCVRDAAACTFEARAPGAAWQPVGSAIDGVDAVEVRAHGDDIEVLAAGVRAGAPESAEVLRIATRRGACTPVRARVGAGFSAPVYVNCGL